jgi:hypothetical protein
MMAAMILTKKATIAAGAVVTAAVVAVTGFAFRSQPVDQLSDAHIEWVSGTSTSTELEVTYLAGPDPGCGEPYGVKVSENPDAVTLTAQTITRDIPPEGRACSAAGVETTQIVTLKSPLGARPVLDRSRLANGEPGDLPVKVP